MQFFIDQNQVTYPDFLTKVKAANYLADAQEKDIEVHFEDGYCYFIDEKCQKIELNIKSSLKYHKTFFYKNSIYRQPLFKALGVKKSKAKPKVLDCTAGMLKDSLLIYAALGELSICERNPLAQFLISSSLEQESLPNFTFFPKDVREIGLDEFDTFYFDPMYLGHNKKSAPRKEMQFFRDVIGTDDDQGEVLEFLLNKNKRLVLKRSQKSSKYKIPDISFGEKSTIYDVYLPR
jgi:hypothetical protein